MNKHLHCPDESHLCQHGEDESCPAMNTPESETPETDEFSNPSTEGDNDSFVAIEHYNSLLEHARSLERRLSLAQTEIKGHMRVVDELKLRIAELEKELRGLKSVAS